MSQITIRGVDPAVESIIRQRAALRHQSLSEVANQLLQKAVGLESKTNRNRNLRDLASQWTHEEAQAFDATQKSWEQIDEELWK